MFSFLVLCSLLPRSDLERNHVQQILIGDIKCRLQSVN